jgi:hypothetical protein
MFQTKFVQKCYVIAQCLSSLFWLYRVILLQRLFVFTLSYYVWPLRLHTMPYARTFWQCICTQNRICIQNNASTHYVQYPVPTVHCRLHPAPSVQCATIKFPSHIHQLGATVPLGLLHIQVLAIYNKLIKVISYPFLRWTKDLKTLYRAFHNVLRDYKNLLYENHRTPIYETCIDRRNN